MAAFQWKNARRKNKAITENMHENYVPYSSMSVWLYINTDTFIRTFCQYKITLIYIKLLNICSLITLYPFIDYIFSIKDDFIERKYFLRKSKYTFTSCLVIRKIYLCHHFFIVSNTIVITILTLFKPNFGGR